MSDNYIFPTQKDNEAFKETLTRAIFPISKQVDKIQKTETDRNCQTEFNCGKTADYKLMQTSGKESTKYICINCIEKQVDAWTDKMLENMKENLDRYKTAEQL